MLNARSGQDLHVRVASDRPAISYQIFNPDGSFLLDQIPGDTEYRGQLWRSDDRIVEVTNRTSATVAHSVNFGIE